MNHFKYQIMNGSISRKHLGHSVHSVAVPTLGGLGLGMFRKHVTQGAAISGAFFLLEDIGGYI